MIVCASCLRPEARHAKASPKLKHAWERIACRRDPKGRLALTSTRVV
jgi:hypothetical protein